MSQPSLLQRDNFRVHLHGFSSVSVGPNPRAHIGKQLNKIHFIGFPFSPVLCFLFPQYAFWNYFPINYLHPHPFLRLLQNTNQDNNAIDPFLPETSFPMTYPSIYSYLLYPLWLLFAVLFVDISLYVGVPKEYAQGLGFHLPYFLGAILPILLMSVTINILPISKSMASAEN